MIRVVTDSGANLPQAVVREYDIEVVPLVVNIAGTGYREGIDLGPEQFYTLLQQVSTTPTTSQPAPADFAAAYRKVVDAGDEVVALTLSSKLSGTHNSAVQAVQLLDGEPPVSVVDTKSVSVAEGLMAVAAARAARAGRTRAEIVEMVDRMANESLLAFSLETLEYLKRGGRIGGARAFLGSILRIQPVIVIKDGLVEAADRARNRRRAIERLVEMQKDRFGSQPVWAGVAHAVSEADAAILLSQARQALNIEYLIETEIGPVVGAHGGPGALGIVAVPAPGV